MEISLQLKQESEDTVGKPVPLYNLGPGGLFFLADQFRGSESDLTQVMITTSDTGGNVGHDPYRMCVNLYSGFLVPVKVSQVVVEVNGKVDVEVGDEKVTGAKYAEALPSLAEKELV